MSKSNRDSINDKILSIEKDIETAVPYLGSDEKSTTLKEAYNTIEIQPEDNSKQQIVVKPWVHFVAGGLGGMCGAIFTCPFDVVKTRLQSSVYRDLYVANSKQVSGNGIKGVTSVLTHFKETCHILSDVYKHEGGRALFKGLGPSLIGVIPARSINFFTYGYSKDLLKQFDHFKGSEETSFLHLLAGINAGIVTSTATNPIWLIKTRLQLDKASKKEYKNSVDCIRKIIKNEGFFALYRGLSASYLGSAESTLQWILYEQMKQIIKNRSDRLEREGNIRTSFDNAIDWFARSGAAGFAKLVASLITYPHEVVRTRLRQAPSGADGKPKYTGLIQCFKLVIKEEGFVSMYGGLTPHLMRTVPNSMIMFGTWEIFTLLLNKL